MPTPELIKAPTREARLLLRRMRLQRRQVQHELEHHAFDPTPGCVEWVAANSVPAGVRFEHTLEAIESPRTHGYGLFDASQRGLEFSFLERS